MKKYFFYSLFLFVLLGNTSLKSQTKVTFYTSMGNFVAELYDTLQPITAGNFKTLTNQHFYDGIIFHRVINGFVIQGGDPTGTGTGGPGYTIPDEFDPMASNIQRSLGMANSGPNTGGSQFYINLVNNTYLNPNYPVFGRVVSTDFSVVQAIGAVATDTNDRPLVDVVMDSVRITSFPTNIEKSIDPNRLTIEIWPNPIQSNSRLQIQSSQAQSIQLSVMNLLGQEIASVNQELQAGVNTYGLDSIIPRHAPPGNYVLLIKNKSEIIPQKITLAD